MGALIALVIGSAVVLLVPALVWATVIAGLYQIMRDKIRKSLKEVTWGAQ